jgi:NADH dehydrogenase
MQDRLVTVFGGSGFVGRYVVKHLAEQGARVRVAVRRPDNALFLKPMGTVGQIVPMQANLRSEPSVAVAVAGADAVVNLVAVLYERGPQSFAALHARGAAVVARQAAAAGVKHLVQVSSLSADPTSPSAYARSKAAGEAAVREAFPAATIVRPSIVFGAEDQFFNRFAALAQLSPALPLIGGGTARYQPVYVGDVAAAIVRALEEPGAAGKTYELGGPRTYTFAELLQMMLHETGRRRLLLPLPVPLANFMAFFMELGSRLAPIAPPLTRDQIALLGLDNVVAPGALGLGDLGLVPTAVEGVLPSYLLRFRRGGKTVPRFG